MYQRKQSAWLAPALHWLLGEAQLREHARHPGLACAKQSQRSAQNPLSVDLEGREHDGEIKEAVRLARYIDPHDSRAENNHVEMKRTDGSATILRVVWRMLPRNGGRAFFLSALLRHATPSRLWLGMGQLFGMVEQSQENQLAMPVLCSAALLFRRRLSPSRAGVVNSAPSFEFSETCLARSRGFLTSLHPSMILASTRLCARIAPNQLYLVGCGLVDSRRRSFRYPGE